MPPFLTSFSIYRGNCESYTCASGNDDFCGLYSSVNFLGDAGEQFLVMIHGYEGNDVSFEIHTSKVADQQLSCEDAYPINFEEPIDGDTGLGFYSDIPECGVSNDPSSPEVFYKFIAPFVGSYQVDTCGSSIATQPTDTKISVYSGGCDEPVCIVGSDDAGGDCGFYSLAKFDADEVGWPFF